MRVYGDIGTVKMGVFFSAGADEKAEALPIEGGAMGLDVPERGREDRDLDVVVCEPDRVRVSLFRVVFALTRLVDGDRMSG